MISNRMPLGTCAFAGLAVGPGQLEPFVEAEKLLLLEEQRLTIRLRDLEFSRNPGLRRVRRQPSQKLGRHSRHARCFVFAQEPPPVLLPTSPIDYVSGYLLAFGVLAALHHRAREGGSYLVRASLARTAMWIDSFGLVPVATLEGRSDAIVRNKLAELASECETPEGLVRHLSSPTRF
jgi:CoA-transferase family III